MTSFLHFQSSIGSRLVRVDEVIEVIPMVELQRDVTDSNHFCGLLNYRGKIVPVFDLMEKNEKSAADVHSFLIVTHCGEGNVALLAREVNLIVEIKEDAVRKITPINLPEFEVAKLEDEMVRIVSPQEFIT